jgi:hypothetical protein
MKSLKQIFAERTAGIEISFNRFRTAAVIIATGLTFVSCYFSGELFEKFALDETDKAVWWCLAALLQGGMSVLAFFAGYSIMMRTGKAWIPTVMFLFLFAVSMICSLGAMSEGSAVRESGATSVADRKETILAQIDSLDEQIKWNKEQMEDFGARSVFTKGVLPLKEQNDALFEQNQGLNAMLLDLQSEKTTDGNALFASLANIFGGAPADFKDRVHFAISFAIDGTSIVLMLLAGGFAMGGIAGRDEYYVQPDYDRLDDPELDNTREKAGHRDAPEFISGDEDGSMYEIHSKPYNPEAGFFSTTLPAFLNWRKDRPEPQGPPAPPRQDEFEPLAAPAEPVNRKFEDFRLNRKADFQTTEPVETSAPPRKDEPEPLNRKIEPETVAPEPEVAPVSPLGTVEKTTEPEPGASGSRTSTSTKEGATPEPVTGTSEPETKTEQDKFSEYKRILLENIKPDGSTIGRRKIADMIEISQKQADAFHSRLKKTGMVRVEKMKTFPLFTAEQV